MKKDNYLNFVLQYFQAKQAQAQKDLELFTIMLDEVKKAIDSASDLTTNVDFLKLVKESETPN